MGYFLSCGYSCFLKQEMMSFIIPVSEDSFDVALLEEFFI